MASSCRTKRNNEVLEVRVLFQCSGKLLMGFMWGRDLVPSADGTGCMEVMTETKQGAKQENQFGGFSLGWEILTCFCFLICLLGALFLFYGVFTITNPKQAGG